MPYCNRCGGSHAEGECKRPPDKEWMALTFNGERLAVVRDPKKEI